MVTVGRSTAVVSGATCPPTGVYLRPGLGQPLHARRLRRLGKAGRGTYPFGGCTPFSG